MLHVVMSLKFHLLKFGTLTLYKMELVSQNFQKNCQKLLWFLDFRAVIKMNGRGGGTDGLQPNRALHWPIRRSTSHFVASVHLHCHHVGRHPPHVSSSESQSQVSRANAVILWSAITIVELPLPWSSPNALKPLSWTDSSPLFAEGAFLHCGQTAYQTEGLLLHVLMPFFQHPKGWWNTNTLLFRPWNGLWFHRVPHLTQPPV